jgi:hypothetical protein
VDVGQFVLFHVSAFVSPMIQLPNASFDYQIDRIKHQSRPEAFN